MASLVYLNTASCGLIAPASLYAGNKLYADFAHSSSRYSELWAQQDEGRIRQVVADFIWAPVKNAALIPNFSWAMNGIVQSLKGSERILLYRNDFPSLLQPFTINNFPTLCAIVFYCLIFLKSATFSATFFGSKKRNPLSERVSL